MPVDFRDRGRARERLTSASRRTILDHERYSSLVAITSVKIMLVVILVALFGLMLRLSRTTFREIGPVYRFFLPATIGIVVIVMVSDIRKRIKELAALRRELRTKDR